MLTVLAITLFRVTVRSLRNRGKWFLRYNRLVI
jgi:hypothetical protein